jgi:hypothetical protein
MDNAHALAQYTVTVTLVFVLATVTRPRAESLRQQPPGEQPPRSSPPLLLNRPGSLVTVLTPAMVATVNEDVHLPA